MKTHFYELSQNNSGGSFVVDDNLCHRLIIEAHSEQQAIEKAEELGCYWNGVEDGHDCECCGDRWSQYAHEVDLGRYKETGYKVRVFDHQDDPEGRWRQKYGHYPCLKQPEWETNYGSRSFSGSIYFDSIEQYGQFMADEYGWTAPDVRIFYLDGRKTDILISTSNRL